jgi:hypothetical protein
MATIVFRGGAASAEVVAGFLRATGTRFVDVVPATPYPAGPLRYAFVRVLEDADDAMKLLGDWPKPRRPVPVTPFPLWMRLLAIFLLSIQVLIGPV